MTLKTVPVTGTLFNPNGSVAANASVVATLTVVDTDGGIVVPSQVTATADGSGVFTLNLWPNSRGVNGSQYRVRAQMPGALPGVLLVNLLITVPDSDPAVPVPIAVITNRTGPAALSDAKAAMLAAQGFAVQASGAGASAASATASAAAAAGSAASVAFLYPSTSASAPTTRPDGSAVQNGDRYNNSTDATEYIRINGVWTNAANSAQAAAASAAAALVSQNASAASASGASGSATVASAASNSSTLASATAGAYPNAAASNVPRGLTQASVGAITPGAGGANGTFALAWSGGNFSINPTGTFTVAGGVLTAVTITGPGLYIGAAPTVPTPSFAASAGLTGAAVALTAQFLVTSGQGYWVQSSDGFSLVRYKNVAGVATLDSSNVHSVPTTDVTDPLHATAVSSVEYAIQDGNDNASEYIEPSTGKRYVLALDAESVNGYARYRVRKALRSAPRLNASLVGKLSYGQSLALGNSGGIHTLAGADVDGFFDCKMFNANGTTSAGPRAQEGSGTAAQNHASLIPYVEQPVSGTAPNGNFETPLGNGMRTIKRLLRDEDGISYTDYDYILIGSAPGQANTAIAGLAKGSAPYTNLMADVTYGLARAAALGKSYCVDDVWFSQGESDIDVTARVTYKNALLQLYTDLNTDIKAATGQTNDIKLVMYQCTQYNQVGQNVPLAQLDAAKANSSIILATAVYALEHLTATNVHLAAAGYAHLGAYYGYAAKRVIVDGDTWQNLYPTRITRQGTILDVEFPDTGYPLTLSNTLFPTQTNSGFTAVNVDGTTNNPITSVTVVSPRRLRIVLTNALAGFLRYGFASWGGNLHDTCDIDPGTARELKLYRPCLTFDEAFV